MIRASVFEKDEELAVEKLASQMDPDSLAGLIFFASDDYNEEKLFNALVRKFTCPVVGCTSAGDIGDCYQEHGVTAVGFRSQTFRFAAEGCKNLSTYSIVEAQKLAEKLSRKLGPKSDRNTVAFCLIDGLSVAEESFVSCTYQALNGIPLIGGSAGDSLKFEKTTVFCEDSYGSDMAAVVLLETDLDFEIFQLKHFVPSNKELIITEANSRTRTVYEIDGMPAVETYANMLGLEIDKLDPQIFAEYPVILEIGNEWFVRSIQKANEDGSLSFFCAVDEGLPLTIAEGVGIVENLTQEVSRLKGQFEEIVGTLGCDCILRKLEMQRKGVTPEIENQLKEIKFCGFSTFGEQYNSIHINQTLTGVVFGKKA